MTTEHGAKVRARTVAIPDPGVLADLFAGPDGVAWLRRGDGFVGFGVAATLDCASPAEAAAAWADYASSIDHTCDIEDGWGVGPLAVGSFVFDAGATTDRARLVVPRVIVGRREGEAWLTVIGDGEARVPDAAALGEEPAARVGAANLPDDTWCDRVATVTALINDPATQLDKVVLARAVSVIADEPLSASRLVRQLTSSYPSCWTFHVEGLVGASPEMLVRTQDGLVTSRVLAGTIKRSQGDNDHELAEALFGSGKDLEEHRFAVASVASAMRPFCTGMNVPDAPFVLELPNVMHLASDVTGVARPGTTSLELAGRLHPSAAVCGTPTDLARLVIREHESLDRGRYAGPVGWIDMDGDGEWAIALRAGQLQEDPREIVLYAGCGIVGRSEPEAELAETRAKLRPMLGALGL